MRVSLAKSDLSFSVTPAESLLDAALRSGLRLPHGCRGGNCGACRARLLHGEIHYPNGPPLGLAAAEVRDDYILLCQARASSDVAIETFEQTTPDATVVKRLPSRIERTERLSHDVMAVHLRLPAAEPFAFEPGQYIDILLSGGRRRSFSIASPPHDSRLLELHVRRVSGGELTERLFAGEMGTLLTIEGPLGRFVYRDDRSAPMLLVGGGTGLAPLKSILRHVTENSLDRPLLVYWGVRSERDLYAHRELQELTRRSTNVSYQAVLSEPDPTWHGRRGWVHDAVLEDLGSLDPYDIYASGPPAMIGAVADGFRRRGAREDRLFVDSFDYASDTLARQRSSVDTKA